jgi:upstream activation factor subunit UAF30
VLSSELAAFLDRDTMARTEIVKKMWEYFKAKELQNPKDKREILLDEPLRAIFKVKKFTMFSMNKHITKHAWTPEEPLPSPKKARPAAKKKAQAKVKSEGGAEKGGKKAKKEKDPNARKAKQPM